MRAQAQVQELVSFEKSPWFLSQLWKLQEDSTPGLHSTLRGGEVDVWGTPADMGGQSHNSSKTKISKRDGIGVGILNGIGVRAERVNIYKQGIKDGSRKYFSCFMLWEY